MVSPNEKDVETMPTQKTFKQRVRTRMTKTGESYTAARHQLLRKVTEPVAPEPQQQSPSTDPLTSDDAMLRGSGRDHAEWFSLLDAWGATDHGHTEIARWLSETHGVPGWWTQTITVAYERSRGMRGRHQMGNGYSISVTKTVAVDAERALAAFTKASLRKRWLADGSMRQRPTRAALSARFDWSDPASRVIVAVIQKAPDKATVAVTHEQLPDGESAERFKSAWRDWLGALKAQLERN